MIQRWNTRNLDIDCVKRTPAENSCGPTGKRTPFSVRGLAGRRTRLFPARGPARTRSFYHFLFAAWDHRVTLYHIRRCGRRNV